MVWVGVVIGPPVSDGVCGGVVIGPPVSDGVWGYVCTYVGVVCEIGDVPYSGDMSACL